MRRNRLQAFPINGDRRRFLQTLAAVALIPYTYAYCKPVAGPHEDDLSLLLAPIRRKYDLPALAAAAIISGKPAAQGVVGVRKDASGVKATVADQFHLGSDTKAMTATLCGLLVERGKLAWDMTLPQAFPDLMMAPGYRTVTLDHLLAHRSGFSPESWPKGQSIFDMFALAGTPRQQRAAYVRAILQEEPVVAPGSQFVYSNRNYAVAGAMIESATDIAWDDIIRRELFTPLGMHSAGFGAMGTPGRIDQPWQHKIVNGHLLAFGPGLTSDNPPVIAPAGEVHCSVGDWAKFVMLHLEGEKGTSRVLRPETLRRLHTPQFGGDYAGGWIITDRPWGGGRVLTHAGSNTMNYAVAWVAPLKDFAVLVMTNEGGDKAAQATDDAATAIILRYL
jgi:CubicO group peptidase (beta-lactamase class C family)